MWRITEAVRETAGIGNGRTDADAGLISILLAENRPRSGIRARRMRGVLRALNAKSSFKRDSPLAFCYINIFIHGNWEGTQGKAWGSHSKGELRPEVALLLRNRHMISRETREAAFK